MVPWWDNLPVLRRVPDCSHLGEPVGEGTARLGGRTCDTGSLATALGAALPVLGPVGDKRLPLVPARGAGPPHLRVREGGHPVRGCGVLRRVPFGCDVGKHG